MNSQLIEKPKVAILLATYNGIAWIEEQVFSILNQVSVEVKIFVSDDFSSDGTFEWIQNLAENENRIVLLPRSNRFGSAGKNFYRLICDVDFSGYDYIAFSDQDDVWNLDKLKKHIHLIRCYNSEGVSSNVLAFWSDGAQKLIRKSQIQKLYDFLFESAGPGCTFLISKWLVGEVRRALLLNESAREFALHDWLTYAICRANGRNWKIDSAPSLQYRQHQNNVLGANSGFKAAFVRLKLIKSGWYRHQVALLACVVSSINTDIKFSDFKRINQEKSLSNNLQLLPFALEGRRNFIDRLFLVLSIVLFIY